MARNGLARAFLRSPLLKVKRTQRFRRFWPVHETSDEKSVSRNFFLRCGSHPHVRARRVFDNRELATAGFSRRNAVGIKSRYPFVPDRPPRALMRRSASKPFVRARRQIVVRPVTIFAAWCADHASDMARRRQNELDRTGIEAGRCIGRFPWRNVVLARR